VFLHEQRPVSSPRWDGGAEVAEVPGEDQTAPGSRHRHHDTVYEIETRVDVSLDEIERMAVLAIGRTIQPVNASEQSPPEDECASHVAAGAQDEVNLHVHWPRDENSSAERGQETRRKLMAPTFGAVARRDQGAAVADDQSPTRESTSSTRNDKSGSSSMRPA